jgi:hypothetical protein
MTRFRLPKPDYRARFALMGYGLLIFVWMSLEDNGTLTVSLLGAGLATALILYQLLKLFNFSSEEWPVFGFFVFWFVLGIFVGAASTIATILLMFFKTAWHGHEFPDYPLELMSDMLVRLPAWALAGGLIGLGISSLWALSFPKELVRGESYALIPLSLAKHIAKALGTPSLYIGEFNGLEIKYIWFLTHADAWHFPFYSTIVISSNKWLRAMNIDWGLQETTKIVDISETDDEIVKLLKQHENFDSNDLGVLDGSLISFAFVSKDEIRFQVITNPDLGKPETLEFQEVISKMGGLVHKQSEQSQNVVSRAITIRNYDGDFMNFLRFAQHFGLSGLFGQSQEPHNLEFILDLRLRYQGKYYVFVKTASWFRAAQFGINYIDRIANLSYFEHDWQKLIKQHKSERDEVQNVVIDIIFYCEGKAVQTQLYQSKAHDVPSPLWNALRPLIEQIKEA